MNTGNTDYKTKQYHYRGVCININTWLISQKCTVGIDCIYTDIWVLPSTYSVSIDYIYIDTGKPSSTDRVTIDYSMFIQTLGNFLALTV